MTSCERLKDLADVQELIKILNLPMNFAESLNPFVREKFAELWRGARPAAKRYVKSWKGETDAIPQAMLADGVTLEPKANIGDNRIYLITTDPLIAKKYGLHEESEFLDREGGGQ